MTANAKNSGLMRDGIVYAISMDGKSKPDATEDLMPTLIAPDKQSKVTAVCHETERGCVVIEGNGSSGSHLGPGYAESEVMYTLNTIEHHAVCYRKSIKAAKDKGGDIWLESDTTNTLNGFEFHSQVRTPEIVVERNGSYMFENHAHDSRYTGPLEVSQTVSQLFGTGGNNTPLIVEDTT